VVKPAVSSYHLIQVKQASSSNWETVSGKKKIQMNMQTHPVVKYVELLTQMLVAP